MFWIPFTFYHVLKLNQTRKLEEEKIIIKKIGSWPRFRVKQINPNYILVIYHQRN